MGHIELARWADVVVVRARHPRTSWARSRRDLGGDLLSTVCLATTVPIVLVPAMNQAMWANTAVQANRGLLEARGNPVLRSRCRRSGLRRNRPGPNASNRPRLPRRCSICRASFDSSRSRGSRLSSRPGPRAKPIDPVRYITNRSSGKNGFRGPRPPAREAGANVVLVAGPVALADAGERPRRIDVETADQMFSGAYTKRSPTPMSSSVVRRSPTIARRPPSAQEDQA